MKARKPIARKTPLKRSTKAIKRSNKPIKKVSDTRAAQNKEYLKERAIWIKDKVCEVCWNVKASQCHHKGGRIGGKINDQEEWLPICHPCHERVTRDSKWAIEQGYSKRRNT